MEIKSNKPTLRFPEFGGEWEKKKFGDLFTFRSTNSLSRDKLNYEKGYIRNIHYGDIHTKFNLLFEVKNELVPYINCEVNNGIIKEDNLCEPGDLIIADASEDYNDIGKAIEIVNINNEKIVAGLHTIHAKPFKNMMVVGYSGFIMKSENVRKQIMVIAQGTKVLSISPSRLSDINLYTPSLPEQQKIADFLKAVDKKLSLLRKKKEGLVQYKKGLMQQIFSQEIRFRPNNSTLLSTSDGEEYPDWEVKKLGEVCTFFSGGTPLTSKREYFDGEIPFIRSGEIHFEKTEQFISDLGLQNSSAKMVERGDILFALYGATSGEVGISKINGAINQAILCIKSSQNHYFITSFLSYQKDIIIKKYLQGGQGNLSTEIVKSLTISFPSLPEQQKIAEFLTGIDEKIDKVERQIKKMADWKKGLMQRMFC